jgi:hypothetical protein
MRASAEPEIVAEPPVHEVVHALFLGLTK